MRGASDASESTSSDVAPSAPALVPLRLGGLRHRFRVFASPADEPRARRPTDVALLLLNCAWLGALVIAAHASSAAEASIDELATQTPQLLAPMWDLFSDLVVVWSASLVLVALVARRLRLCRDLVLAAIGAAIVASFANRVAGGPGISILSQLTASGGPPTFPALKLAVASAVIITVSPHVARPLRYVGRWIVAVATLSTVVLGIAHVGGTIAAIAIAGAVASVVHLAFGSPGGRPSSARIAETLEELGLDVHDVQPAALDPEGVWVVVGRLASGAAVRIKVYGRDAWDGQLVMSLWRFVWYRDAGASVSITRIQLVEHEAFLILLARQAGLVVPTVIAAGRSGSGDAVLVVSSDAVPLDELPNPSDALLAELWCALETAHATGISVSRVDPHTVGADEHGAAVVLELGNGRTAATEEQKLQDGAQLLVSTAMIIGDDRAIDAAAGALGAERLGQLLPFLQPAGMSRTLRRALDDRDYDLNALRTATSERLGVAVPDLVKLRRVTIGSIVQAALLVFVAIAMVNGLSSIDFASVTDEFRAMTLGAVIVGLVLTQVARASGALSNLGASPAPLPLGPVVQLQFAIAYINMAVPSTAGRLALVIRFYQRVGSTASTALGAGALDSFSNFVVQVALIVLTFVFGLGTLDLALDDLVDKLPPGLLHLVVIVVLVFIGLVIAVFAIPALRRKVMPTLLELRGALKVLKSPRNGALLLGGNLLVQVAYALALGCFVEATGNTVGLVDLLLIINIVGTFASLIPVPNGMGVTEAGLTVGLVAAGVPEAPALAAALAYRVFSSYLSPVWGYFSMRWLQRHQYL